MVHYLLQHYLDACRQEFPDKVALVDEERSITYGTLYSESNRLARLLAANGVKRKDRVVICMKRSSLVVMAILGVLKADAMYVPVDGKSPVERLLQILKSCRPAVIVHDDSVPEFIAAAQERGFGPRSFIRITMDGERTGADMSVFRFDGGVANVACLPPAYRNIDTDAAYILYTSGSTGTPKGVVISHLNVANYVDWACDCFGIGPDDRILSTAPFHFDMSTFDIFATLRAGATLCIASERYLLFPNRLLDMMEMERVTIWKGVSSLLMYLSTTGCLKPSRIPSLQKVLFGGEVLPTKHLLKWMTTFPKKKFYNVYGPTEATGISTCYQVEKPPQSPQENVPIGTACANTEIIILNDENLPAAAGEPGELCIRGAGLSMGYWDDREKTECAFVPNPTGFLPGDRIYRTGDVARMRGDGVIEYLGRKDFQVKVMGYRIETFEVERAIVSIEGIDNAAVVLCNTSQGELPELIAFVEAPEALDTNLVMKDLIRSLPSYMVPKRFVPLEKMPMTDRGKTDRGALTHYFDSLKKPDVDDAVHAAVLLEAMSDAGPSAG